MSNIKLTSPLSEPTSLHETVQAELRRRLVTGKIIPGVSLSTRKLAEELGVSQMPVREALSRLAAGNFGECEQCGAPIPVVVLFAAPESRYCPGCTGAALRTDARERVH